jgi:hypothetical protein
MSNSMLMGLGDEQLTVSSTSVALTVPANAARADILVDGASVHMSNDGTAATTGVPLIPNRSVIDLVGNRHQLHLFRFIRAASTDATLHVSYYN